MRNSAATHVPCLLPPPHTPSDGHNRAPKLSAQSCVETHPYLQVAVFDLAARDRSARLRCVRQGLLHSLGDTPHVHSPRSGCPSKAGGVRLPNNSIASCASRIRGGGRVDLGPFCHHQVGTPCWNSFFEGVDYRALAAQNPNVSRCWQLGNRDDGLGGAHLNNHK